MKIAAVLTTHNEVDIVATTVLHLYRQGVDAIYAADSSTDGTYDLLTHLGVTVERDTENYHRQPWWTARLAEDAIDAGADWIVPFDADEYWFPVAAPTLRAALTDVPAGVGKLMGRMWHYHDWEWRWPHPKPHPKVIVRAQPNIVFANGNHNAATTGAELWDVAEVREVQYRSFDHYLRKIEARSATLDPTLPAGEGTHHTNYRGWSAERLAPVWADMKARATERDPLWLR